MVVLLWEKLSASYLGTTAPLHFQNLSMHLIFPQCAAPQNTLQPIQSDFSWFANFVENY